MEGRCDQCASLDLEALRLQNYAHHASLQDLKSCAESGKCDLCLLFWTCIKKSCRVEDIGNYLDGRLSEPMELQDTTIYLSAFLNDLQPGKKPEWPTDGSGSHIWICSGESQSRVHCFSSLFAEPLTFAAKYLRERNTVCSKNSSIPLRTTQLWLEECISSHDRCGGATHVSMPTRVIDLGDLSMTTTPKLCITGGRPGRYMALSYSWGEGVRHKIQLETKTIEQFQIAIPEDEMTRSHQEALRIGRELGYQYVWIDAFGIIQDDKVDWARESTRIADVYGNAEVTLVAGRSDDSRQGFIEHDPNLPSMSCKLRYSRPGTTVPDDSYCFVALQRSQATGPVDRRAWCFQESTLARRMVVYGEQQLGFKCRQRSDWEDGGYTLYRWGSGGRYDISAAALEDPSLGKEDIMKRWHQLTMQYSTKNVFDPSDGFAALAGVAVRFQQAIGCRYLAGLWEDDMIRGLLWKSRRLLVGPHSHDGMRKPIGVKKHAGREIVRAPSWSWLALQGPILPATQRSDDRRLQDRATYQCRPAHEDRVTWTEDPWDPGVVVYPFPPCRLQVLGCPRKVRLSSLLTSGLKEKLKWQFSRAKLNHHAVLLEAADEGDRRNDDRESVVAMGLFDVPADGSTTLWAMCLSVDEGLLLEGVEDGTFSRLGVFIVEHEGFFTPTTPIHVTLV